MRTKVRTFVKPAAMQKLQRSAACRLIRARHAANLTQEQTAVLCGVDRVTVTRRELGQFELGALLQLEALEAFAEEQKRRAA